MRFFWEDVTLAAGTFRAHPLRSLLTLVGIVIGVATVVTMMALIEGLQTKVTRDLSQLGAHVFRVDKFPAGLQLGGNRVDWARMMQRPDLTIDDRRAILEHCPSVQTVSASTSRGGIRVSTSSTSTTSNVMVVGATAEYVDTSGLSLAEGRFLSDAEDISGREIAVVGQDVADTLFPGTEVLGQTLRIQSQTYTVVGILSRRGKWLGMINLDNIVIIPMNSFLSSFGRRRSLTINVQAATTELQEKAMGEVERLMRARRKVPADRESNFEMATNESMTKTLNDLSSVITAATFGICFLSLLVGGIGILNIMLVSVTERTREIGIRKALGATRRRILSQFATEAVALSLVGGAVGIGVGYFLAFLVRWTMGLSAAVPAWAVALSLAMSSGVGLVFGIYPAMKASQLTPVEAMRAD